MRKDFFTFHLSVKNRIANKYGIITPTDTDKPSMANFVKSAVSNNNSTVDQIKFGIYNITVENAVGTMQAMHTDNSKKENTTPMKGTNRQFNSNAHPDKYPK